MASENFSEREGLAPLRLIADLGIGPGAADPGLSGCGEAVRRPAFSRTGLAAASVEHQ